EAFYLPERAPDAASAAVPPEDAELIRRVLEAPPRRGAAPVIAVATRDEIDRHWEGRALDVYEARLELREPPQPFVADEVRALDALVENRTGTVWPWGEAHPEI